MLRLCSLRLLNCWPVNYLIVAFSNHRRISTPHPPAWATQWRRRSYCYQIFLRMMTVNFSDCCIAPSISNVDCCITAESDNKTLKEMSATFCVAETWRPSNDGAFWLNSSNLDMASASFGSLAEMQWCGQSLYLNCSQSPTF